jgi:hypothetical protein
MKYCPVTQNQCAQPLNCNREGACLILDDSLPDEVRPSNPTPNPLQVALSELPDAIKSGMYTDPQYVIDQMQSIYGDAFTSEMQADVRAMFPE